MELTIKKVKKALCQSKIKLTQYTLKRMEKRGYTKSDLIHAIWHGEITKVQRFKGLRVVIESVDCYNAPIVLVVGLDHKGIITVVTVFPPIQDKFRRVI